MTECIPEIVLRLAREQLAADGVAGTELHPLGLTAFDNVPADASAAQQGGSPGAEQSAGAGRRDDQTSPARTFSP
ncbi:MAG: hypothetical protein ACM3U2_09960, partial [Deltaproteobacteria bacterium]